MMYVCMCACMNVLCSNVCDDVCMYVLCSLVCDEDNITLAVTVYTVINVGSLQYIILLY